MTGPADLYRYQALLLPWAVSGTRTLADAIRSGSWGLSWHDGDTFCAHVDMGVRGFDLLHVRPAGYNSPEINTLATRAAATVARDYAASLVDTGGIVYLDSISFQASSEEDNFGRMLAVVTLADGRDLATLMIESGNAVPDPD